MQSIKKFIWKTLKGNKPYYDFPFKPFECSLCMGFWSGLIYLLFTNSFSLPYIAFVCLLSFMSSTVKSFLWTVKELVDKVIDKIDNWLQD